VWIALKMLKDIDVIKVIFTVQEECGVIGAANIDQTFLEDIGYYLEGDRKGSGDIITTYFSSAMTSPAFDEKIFSIGKYYGYEKSDGVFTDVCTLYEMNEVSAINVSVGYYNAHQNNEYTIWEELVNALYYMKALVNQIGNKKFPVEVEKYSFRKNRWGHYNYDYDYAYGYGSNESFKDYDDFDAYYEAKYGGNKMDKKKEEEKENTNHNTDFMLSHKKVLEQYGSFHDKEEEEEEDTSHDSENCIAHIDEFYQALIDIDCEICNPFTFERIKYFCNCGEPLVKRKFTLFCKVCQTHKLEEYVH